MTPDGENIAYDEFNIGRMLPTDIDRNSEHSLSAPFRMADEQNEVGVESLNVSHKNGTDAVFGKYSSTQVDVTPFSKSDISVGKYNLKTDVGATYSNLKTDNTVDGVGRTNSFNNLGVKAQGILESPDKKFGKDGNFSFKHSLYSSVDGNGTLSKNTHVSESAARYTTSMTVDGEEVFSNELPDGAKVTGTETIDFGDGEVSVFKDVVERKTRTGSAGEGFVNVNALPGVSLEYNKDNFTAGVNAYSGVRLKENTNMYEQNLKLKPELRAGAELSTSYNSDNGLNANLTGGVHQVNSSTYSNTVFSGGASVGYTGKKGQVSIGAQSDYKNLNIHDVAKEQQFNFSTGINAERKLSGNLTAFGGAKYNISRNNSELQNKGWTYNAGLRLNL